LMGLVAQYPWGCALSRSTPGLILSPAFAG
jgi:hypothetical protein